MDAAPSPAISVVLAARHCGPALARCVASLARQTWPDAEALVATACGHQHDWNAPVRHLSCDASLDEPHLLQLALQQARGHIVAVTDPHCVLPEDWLGKLVRAHDSEFAVIGGAVAHGGPDTLPAWACYLADYGAFGPAKPRGVSAVLAGSHISYKRAVLDGSAERCRDGYWKAFFLQDLARRGMRFLFDPAAVVFRMQDHGFREFARRYYRNGRQFAAARARAYSPATRLAHVLTAPALPLLLLYRRLLAAWSSHAQRARLLAALPLIAVLVLCWSAGELAGYVRGGPALSRFSSE